MNIFDCIVIAASFAIECDERVWRATLTLPDRRTVTGPGRPNTFAAVHAALEAYHGAAFAEPFPEHFEPIVRRVLLISPNTEMMVWQLSKWAAVVSGGRTREMLEAEVATHDTRAFIEQQCRELEEEMARIAADPLAQAARDHPIWPLAECTAREGMRRCEQVKRKFGAPVIA